MKRTVTKMDSGDHFHKSYDEPDECPLCHYAIQPEELYFKEFPDRNEITHVAALFLCKHCYQIFAVLYDIQCEALPNSPAVLSTRYVGPTKYLGRSFDQHIHNISPSFVKIYNQARKAESMDLDEIAGIGYRKALQFLIKH